MNEVAPYTTKEVNALVAFHRWANAVRDEAERDALNQRHAAYIEADALAKREVERIQHPTRMNEVTEGIVHAEPLLSIYPHAAEWGDALAPELSEPLEYIGVGDWVRIDPQFGIGAFDAIVEAVYEDEGMVQVYHRQGGYPAGTWAVEDVRLVLTREATAVEVETATA